MLVQSTQRKKNKKPERKYDDLILEALARPFEQAEILPTIKGHPPLLYKGMKYNYKFKRGPYKIFMCCFTDLGVECEFRVILHSNKVYPIEGSHSHLVEADNKEVCEKNSEDEANKFLGFKEDIKQRLQQALLKKKQLNKKP